MNPEIYYRQSMRDYDQTTSKLLTVLLLLAVVILLFGAVPARAQSDCNERVTITWTLPDTREDGTPLPASEIGSVTIWRDNPDFVRTLEGALTSFQEINPIPSCEAGTVNYYIAPVTTTGISAAFTDAVAVTFQGGRVQSETGIDPATDLDGVIDIIPDTPLQTCSGGLPYKFSCDQGGTVTIGQ